MGFYPVNPASGEYLIGSPLFRRMTLKLAGGKRFEVVAENNSAANVYVQSAELNGVVLQRPVISYAEIVGGGTLKFVMGARASRWGAGWKPGSLREGMATK
jgi:putative alpha-1,2-mannosidase